MFLKSLTISGTNRIVREIVFRNGINLIVDETPEDNQKSTGNSVGKTTVLVLIDFCLGAKANNIWVDPETRKAEYSVVKDYLVEKKVLITLILKDDLMVEESREILIERNFLPRKEIIRRINDKDFTEEEFEVELSKLIFPNLAHEKPTFRQIISHNIRYRDQSINNTLRTLDKFSTDVEYETLHLFMLGVDYDQGSSKQMLLAKLKQEEIFKSRLEKNQSKNAYEAALALVEIEIEELSKKKVSLNLNKNFESDFEKLNEIKYRINKVSSELSTFNMRKELIMEAEHDLKENRSQVDVNALRMIYEQAVKNIGSIQKTFEELVSYHNSMIDEKVRFITKELPKIDDSIKKSSAFLRRLLDEEKIFSEKIAKSDSFDELERLLISLNENYRKKGEYENVINQLNETEGEMRKLNAELAEIDSGLFSEGFEQKIKVQTNKFNKFFANISNELYGEPYALKYEKITNRKGQRLYKFSAFNANMSSGKKQGEISSFDIAYTMFADDENIPCLHFLLNDKKELMHDHQLVKISELCEKVNIQFVASILKDKLPSELDNDENIILKLSQNDKLFRIENDPLL